MTCFINVCFFLLFLHLLGVWFFSNVKLPVPKFKPLIITPVEVLPPKKLAIKIKAIAKKPTIAPKITGPGAEIARLPRPAKEIAEVRPAERITVPKVERVRRIGAIAPPSKVLGAGVGVRGPRERVVVAKKPAAMPSRPEIREMAPARAPEFFRLPGSAERILVEKPAAKPGKVTPRLVAIGEFVQLPKTAPVGLPAGPPGPPAERSKK